METEEVPGETEMEEEEIKTEMLKMHGPELAEAGHQADPMHLEMPPRVEVPDTPQGLPVAVVTTITGGEPTLGSAWPP